ncbi:hypothetical protein [Dokdonia sp.]|uniref:hypothetical protein n=1 Tax=Dokdonia sp. TaxID=2024995 RepID=UPI003264C288
MLKNISNLGTQLSKSEQQRIQAGDAFCKGGCVGKNAGDPCYTSSGGCRTRLPGVCQNFGGTLGCNPF